MSFGIWQRTITDDEGNVLPGASIEVRAPSSNFTGALVSLFSDESGSTGLANPFNADSEGFAQFYAAPRKVDIRATGSGSQRTWRNVEILGTAATADKQTSPTDTTAGALMPVGAGGLLESISIDDTVDLNTLTLTANYSISTSGITLANNYPFEDTTGTFKGFTITVKRRSDNALSQQLNVLRSVGPYVQGDIYSRSSFGGVFTPWRKIYHTGNILGTVSQSGGVPTGAIIERGSNSNGEYVKFADGTLFQRFRLIDEGAGTKTWTFPVPFLNSDVVDRVVVNAAFLSGTPGEFVRTRVGVPTNTSVDIERDGTTNSRSHYVTASGVWY